MEAGFSFMKVENLVSTSGNPSRYQTGDLLYIGGAIRKVMPGKAELAPKRAEQNSSSTGSMRLDTMGSSSEAVKKLVRQETMQTSLSFRIARRDSSRSWRWPHCKIWAPAIKGHAREFVFEMFRFTLESPMIVNTRD